MTRRVDLKYFGYARGEGGRSAAEGGPVIFAVISGARSIRIMQILMHFICTQLFLIRASPEKSCRL